MSLSTTHGPAATAAPRAILLSLRPRFAEAILDGSKTVELRRTRLLAPPGTPLVLYASSPVMSVVGIATLAAVETASPELIWRRHRRRVGLDRAEYDAYFDGAGAATALSIESPRRLDTPHELSALRAETGFRPPQSYRYLSPLDPAVLHSVVSRQYRRRGSHNL